MQNLSLIIPFLLLLFGVQTSDSPHGPGFKVNCIDCHTADGWEFVQSESTFDHNTTKFPLKGQHQVVDCRACHVSLVFAEAKKECAECHNDVHQQSVRLDCSRCHTPQSWLVSNVTDIHQMSRFPLMGPHKTATCSDCHKSGNPVQFEPMGIQCIDCHNAQYYATTSPNHVVSGFSTDCNSCHNMQSFEWGGDGFNHSFFPLTGGHDNLTCFTCHQGQPYNQLSPDCFGCHSDDYAGTSTPNHTTMGFGTNCASCHNINGWQPATFDHDGPYFPIYSGEHEGEWNSCSDCHTNPSNYAVFSCTGCHGKNETDGEHDDVGGYSYNSEACLHCHPDGSSQAAFNHNNSGFPLTGGHVNAPCLECHANGYAGTTKVCENCHMPDFNGSLNPNHQAINIPATCATCHTTAPGWAPATFPIHNNYYVITGAHTAIANNCAQCHNGNYINTPNTCIGCHQQDYNQATDPNHAGWNFSTVCLNCHTQNSWSPSTFNHDQQYFRIYSGQHQGEWNSCSDCHVNSSNIAVFSCIDCHEHNQNDMDDEHSGVSGYSWNSNACLNCHHWVEPKQPGGKSVRKLKK